MMYWVKTPQFIQNLFPQFTWRIPTHDRALYLTFDDGPIPEVTPWVLEQLKTWKAKGTFFCVGDNIRKYPEVFRQVVDAGHSVGNHTFNHLNGWAADNLTYFRNVRKCAAQVHTPLFRPPYGKLKPKQAQFLQRHYRIVMWDVLSGDFDPEVSPEQCFANVVNAAGQGSIIVFHDSLKAISKLQYALPKILQHFTELGYVFQTLQPQTHAKPEHLLKIA